MADQKIPLIIANWKMNLGFKKGVRFYNALKRKYIRQRKIELVICPSFIHLPLCKRASSPFFNLGAQNVFYENQGPFTGEISPLMLKELGVEYVIVGHSERRIILQEDSEAVNKKVKAVLKNKMRVILCIGESLKQRKNAETIKSIYHQLKESLRDIRLSSRNIDCLVIAYEPTWAIGTHITPQPDEIQNIAYMIRRFFDEEYAPRIAQRVRILYGGSVNNNNIKKFINKKDLDGFLLGEAALAMGDLAKVVEAVSFDA